MASSYLLDRTSDPWPTFRLSQGLVGRLTVGPGIHMASNPHWLTKNVQHIIETVLQIQHFVFYNLLVLFHLMSL